MVSGVCGGLGRCFDMDPVIFRVALGMLAVTGGLGLTVYGFAWLLIPLEGEDDNEARRMLSGRVDGQALTALLCALVGCGLFLSMLNNGGVMAFAIMLTLALIGAAHWSQQRRLAETDAEEGPEALRAQRLHKAHKAMDAPPETQAPPAPGTPSWWRDPVAAAGGAGIGATGYLWGPDDSTVDDRDLDRGDGRGHGHGPAKGFGPGTRPPAAPAAAGAREPARAPARTGRQLGGWTFLLALAAFGLGVGLTWHHRPLGTSLEIGLACALGVYGLGIAISSRYGRTGGGTVVMATLTAALLVGAAALPKSVTDHWTRTTWRPASLTELRPHYALGTGVGVLDLTGLPWPAGAGTGTAPVTAGAEVGAGKLTVVLPRDVTADLDIEVGVGDVQLPGERRDDIDVQPGQRRHLTLPPDAGQPSHGTVKIELKAGLGQVEVARGTA